MNVCDLIRLILSFIILDIARWNWWVLISLVLFDLLWEWEYNLMLKYDETTKKRNTTTKTNSET